VAPTSGGRKNCGKSETGGAQIEQNSPDFVLLVLGEQNRTDDCVQRFPSAEGHEGEEFVVLYTADALATRSLSSIAERAQVDKTLC
jgi:hypothetical protein